MKIEFESGSKKNNDRTWLNVFFLGKRKKKIKPIQETCDCANHRKQIYELIVGKKYSIEKTIIRKGKCLKGEVIVIVTKNGIIKILKKEGFPVKFTIVSH